VVAALGTVVASVVVHGSVGVTLNLFADSDRKLVTDALLAGNILLVLGVVSPVDNYQGIPKMNRLMLVDYFVSPLLVRICY